MGTLVLDAASTRASVASHATGYGAELAMQARAMFKMGPIVAVQRGEVIAFVREPQPGDAEVCGCTDVECNCDTQHADWQALLEIPGPVADTQAYLSYWAYRVKWDAHNGQPRDTDLALPDLTEHAAVCSWAART